MNMSNNEKSENNAIKETVMPAPTHELGHYEDMMVKMRDGVGLMTRVYFPKGEGPWPVLITRTPYVPVNMEAVDLMPFVNYGYVVVHQQVRGTYESEGKWHAFENDRNDGLDTMRWVTKQSWMDGNIGTIGMSYLGHVQWCLADEVPPEVKAMHITVYGGDPYESFYINGMFKQYSLIRWAFAMWAVMNKLNWPPDNDTFWKAYKARPHIDMDRELLGLECPYYRSWITNPDPNSDYWSKGSWGALKEASARVKTPLMLIGGWFDFFISSMINGYNQLPEETKKESRFIIGPWCHGPQPDYPNSQFPSFADTLEWFDHHLKGKPYNHQKGLVETYVIGEGVWKSWEGGIKPSGSKRFYLHKSVDLNYKGGTLETESQGQSDSISYVYDPDNPVHTKGGANILVNAEAPDEAPACSILQDEPGAREDVITFISEPLNEDLSIAGCTRAHFYVSSDAEDTSFTAKLSEVLPDGSAYNIQDSITTLEYRNGDRKAAPYTPGEIVSVDLELSPITWTVKKGSRLRLDISSSNYPCFNAHPNVAGIWSMQTDVRIARQTLYTGGKYQSFIDIPY
jgi:putative CocE/NonD family hydrolase